MLHRFHFPGRHNAFVAVVIVGLVGGAATLWAHVDDPKIRDAQPPYIGPGYRSAEEASPLINFPASDVQLLAWLPVTELDSDSTSVSTVEGYVSPSGREYAIVGLSGGTGFVEVTDPGSPVIIAFIPGADSRWKDLRVYQQYVYCVSEGGGGIQIMDVGQIDSGVVTPVGNSNTPEGTIAATHTMFINEASGRLYRAGGGSNGLRIYSLANPTDPVYLGAWPDRYVHEVTVVNYTSGPYAGKEIAFCCGGFNNGQVETGVYIVDINNLLDGNPNNGDPQLSYCQYSNSAFAHQGWLSEDKKYFYLNDELDEPFITSLTRILDVSNLSAPFQAGAFTSGATSVDHNLYVKGKKIFESNYRSGLRVFDATDPLNPKQTGYFDTWPEDDNPNYNGLWDVYPYLPSEIVLGGDIEKGLFIWQLGSVQLSFAFPDGLPELIDPQGDSVAVQINEHAGQLQPGSAKLHVDHGKGFEEFPLVEDGSGFDGNFPPLDCGSAVTYYFSAMTMEDQTIRSPLGAPTVTYSAFVGTAELSGIEDDVEQDLGWVVGEPADTATSGIWARVDPVGTDLQPEDDHTDDPGVKCWVTAQNVAGDLPDNNDVDGGTTTLTSPIMDATEGDVAYISYHHWFNFKGSHDPGDSLSVQISGDGGATWHKLETIDHKGHDWTQSEHRIDEVVEPSNQIRLRFVAADVGIDSAVETAVDDIAITYVNCTQITLGDVTGDHLVNVSDLFKIVSQWGQCPGPPEPCTCDIAPPGGDGEINVQDLLMVIDNWRSDP